MTIDRYRKATMDEASAFADAGASEGARRATVDAPASAAKLSPADGGPSTTLRAGMEVVPRGRRFFSKADKQRILQAADRCSAPGEIGTLMRREGVYSSSLSTWRRQRQAAEQAALAPHKRGPKPAADRDQLLQIARLTRDNDRLKNRLDKHRGPKKSRGLAGPSDRTTTARARDRRGARAGAGDRKRRCLPRTRPVARQLGSRPRPRAPRRLARAAGTAPGTSAATTTGPDALRAQVLLGTLNSERFVDTAPAAVHATLLDEGHYLGSVRTMYRLLAANGAAPSGATSAAIPSTASPSCWPWPPTRCGRGISPSSRDRPPFGFAQGRRGRLSIST